MILDSLLMFADSQTVTGGTTTKSSNVIDVGTVARKLGTGHQLFLVIKVISKSGGDSSDTFTFSLVTDDNSSITTGAVVAASRTITGIANITAGMQIVVPIPPGVAFERYIEVLYAVTADAVLVVDAYLTDQEPPEFTAYADGI